MNLYPFQEQAVSEMLHFLEHNETHSVYNACEQGLGKCAMSIECLNRLQLGHVLIICPAIMRLVWLDELQKWWTGVAYGPELVATAALSSTDVKQGALNSDIVIISYDLARITDAAKQLTSKKWDCIICDEAHYLKNTRARRTKLIFRELWERSKYHILLSGTPMTVNVTDLYAPAHKMVPSEFPDFPDFVSRFSFCRTTPWGNQYFGLKNAEALRKIIRSSFYVRYTKKQVLPELPPKTFQMIPLPREYAVAPKGKNEEEQLQIEYEQVKKFLESGKQPVVPSCLAEHRRLQGMEKVPPIWEFIKDLLYQDFPVVVFAYHKSVIAEYARLAAKYKPYVITGETPAKNRQEAVVGFQAGKSNMFLANFIAAGVGVTLTRANLGVLGELDWSPATIAQACDRIYRIGTTQPVTIYWPVVTSSIDETLSRIIMTRTEQFAQVLE